MTGWLSPDRLPQFNAVSFGVVEIKQICAPFLRNCAYDDVLFQQKSVHFAHVWNLPGKRDPLPAHTLNSGAAFVSNAEIRVNGQLKFSKPITLKGDREIKCVPVKGVVSGYSSLSQQPIDHDNVRRQPAAEPFRDKPAYPTLKNGCMSIRLDPAQYWMGFHTLLSP